MRLPFFSSRSVPQELFFGLFLKEKKGVGYIFSGNKDKISLVAKHEFKYSNGWDNLTEDVDDVLFKLEDETKTRIEKTIFFVFSHLVDDATKEIKRPYLQKIKELTKNLEIKPIGYIECYEAVVSFLQQREGTPLTSILIELDSTNAGVFIYKGGHKINNFIVARTNSIVDDLSSVFDTLGKNTLLPNRVILYNSSNLIEESTKIISHKWSSELFVQLPRVEILKEEDMLTGLMSVFEQQIYSDQNIDKGSVDHEEEKEVLGFVIGADVKKKRNFVHKESSSLLKQSPYIQRIFGSVMVFFKKIGMPQVKIMGASKKKYVTAFICILFVGAFFFLLEFFLHKATVKAVFPSKKIDKKVEINGAIDEQKEGYLNIQIATSSVEMKDIKTTTGQRDVGEKAKGEVILYNFDDKEKTFQKGTTIQVDTLQFTTDEDAKVAASTLANDASAKLPGKSKVKVTAVEIGTESNLDKGKRFKITDLSPSTYFALNETAFSGGTRKSIKTVSKKDLDELQASLLQKAKDQQKESIYKAKDKRVTLIDSMMDFQLSNIKFSKELGEEGETITLNAKVVAKYYYFDNALMSTVLKKEMEQDIPEGYVLKEKNISYKIDDVSQGKTNTSLEVHIQAKATKNINTREIISRFRFKQVSQAENELKNIYGTISNQISIAPPLFILGDFMPLFERNIDLRIESN